MGTVNSLEKSLMLGKIKGRRIRGYQRIRRLDNITDAMDMNLGKIQDRSFFTGDSWRPREEPGLAEQRALKD